MSDDLTRSLWTKGSLVRSPELWHGVVEAFDRRTNRVKVKFGANGPSKTYHFTRLRAGDKDTEQRVLGYVTKTFPKRIP